MKKLFILVIIILISIRLNAQKEEIPKAENTTGIFNKIKFDKANDLFNRMAYSGASKLFEELEPSGYRLHDVIAYLGDCYYYLGNTEKAEYYLWQTVSLDSINPLFYYKYAQVLRSNKKYEESDKWMIEYSKHTGKDQLQENMKTPENSIRMADQMGNFAIENRKEINSPYSDFGAIKLGDRIIFTSGRSKSLMIDNSYAWNDKPFLDLYQFIPGEKQKKILTYGNAINTRFHEGPAVFNNNHSVIYFTRNSYIQGRRTNSTQGTTHLMLFTANAVNGKWTNIRELPFNNKEYSVGHPALSPDGKRLYFASNMPGSLGGTDIFYVDITGPDEFSQPVNLGPGINTNGNEMFPFADSSGLYFSSDGHMGLGGLDIFFSACKNDNEFAIPVNPGAPLNSEKDDFSFFLNADKRTGYIASNRPGGLGDDDIYSFTLSSIRFSGILKDTTDNTVIANTPVYLFNAAGKLVDSTATVSDGSFIFPLAYDNEYSLLIKKPGYKNTRKPISTQGLKTAEIKTTINIGKFQPVVLRGIIMDRNNNHPVKNAELLIIDSIQNHVVLDLNTPEDGSFSKELENEKLNATILYKIIIRKPGYLIKNIVFNHQITKHEIALNEILDIAMDKIDIGSDIGKMLNLNPIYFDIGKWDIRPEAATELDKVVRAMTDNPQLVIELGSHTDSRGSSKSNLSLSDKRAKSSVDYIVSKGISEDRITGKGYGESKPLNQCTDGVLCSDEEYRLNRRTEFRIVRLADE